MSTPNHEIVRKANLAVADFAPGGALVSEQATRFVAIALKASVMSSMVRGVMMKSPKMEQPKMLWTGRVLYPSTPGTKPPVAYHSKPTFDKMELDVKEFKGIVPINRDVFEDQIERANFRASLTRFMAERVSADLEDIMIKGDSTSADPTLAHNEGILKLATTYVVDAASATLSADLLDDLQQALPEEFDSQNLMYFTNRKARSSYRRSIKNRATGLGDAVIQGTAPGTLGYDGVPIVKVPRFPNDVGTANTKTNVLYCDPKNIVRGFLRKVDIENEYHAIESTFYIVVTLREDTEFEHEPAVAKMINVVGQ